MADVFIRYKRADEAERGRVAQSARRLHAKGRGVFYDVRMPSGSSWDAVLQYAGDADLSVAPRIGLSLPDVALEPGERARMTRGLGVIRSCGPVAAGRTSAMVECAALTVRSDIAPGDEFICGEART